MKASASTFAQGLSKLPPLAVLMVGIAYLSVVGMLDFNTPLGVSFTLFYLVGIAFVAWGAGPWRAAIVSAFVAALMFVVEFVVVHPRHATWILLWNFGTRLLFFAAAGWLAAEATHLARHLRRLVEERTAQWKTEAERHKTTATSLAEAHERFQQVIGNVTEVFWLRDLPDYKVIYVSPAYERVWGRSCDELYHDPKSWLGAVHPGDREEAARRLSLVHAQGGYDAEYRIIRADGTLRWIRGRAFPVKNDRGEVYRIAGITEDITERKRAGQALRESEERYRSLVNNLNVGVYRNTPGPHGQFIQANPALARMHGYDSLDEFLKTPISELYQNPADRAEFVAEILRQGTVLDHELPLKQKDGTVIFVSVNATAHRDANGQVDWIDGVLEDVTERKLAETALRESEARYRSLFENMLEGFAYCRLLFEDGHPTDFIYLEVNRAFGTLTGLTDVVGKKVSEVIPGLRESNPEVFEIYGRVAETGQPERFERYFERLKIWLSVSVYSPERGCFVTVFDNITERKRAEEALELSRRQLADAMDLAQLANWEYDVATGMFTFDDRFFALYGTTAEREGGHEMTPEQYEREFLFPDDAHLVTDGVAESLAASDDKFSYQGEHRIRRRDGQTRHVVVRVAMVKDAAGRTVRTRGVNQDITERKEAEHALAKKEELYRTLFELCPDGILLEDTDGNILDANRALCVSTGYSREEFLRQNVRRLVPPEDHGEMEAHLAALRAGQKLEHEVWNVRKNGERCLMRLNEQPLALPDGRRGILVVARDITERKRARQQLADALDLNQKMLAASPMGIVAYKASGECVFANKAMARIIGGTIEQHLQQNFRRLSTWQNDGRLALAEEALAKGQARCPELHGHTSFGTEVWLDFQMASFLSNGEPHLLCMVYDIGDRIRAEAVRQRLEGQLLEISDREQARIGQDIHDGLCQQLVGLAFDANLLARDLSAKRKPEAATARRFASLLDRTISDARQLSRGLFPVRLGVDGLASALEQLARSVQERFRVQCLFKQDGPVSIENTALAIHLYRIAQEAVNNAMKHAHPKTVSIQLLPQAALLELRVEDDGRGISGAASGHSQGLGLHIMAYRARSIGGTLRVLPRTEGGTAVSCCVPLPAG
jgi:PAS domain S-box-containing protein